MNTTIIIAQVILGLGILNVWLIRFGKTTRWRGGNATSLKEEFAVYGLPAWVMALVGSLKVVCALALLAGLWVPSLVAPAALTLGALMLGALAMHVKVHDAPAKSVPALVMLGLCVLVGVTS